MKTPIKSIVMVSGLVFITGFTITMTALGVTGGTEEPVIDLSALYEQKAIIDQTLSESLLKQAEANKEVDDLREDRTYVQELIDETIHKPEKDFQDYVVIKAAESEGLVDEPSSSETELCYKKDVDEDQQQYVRIAAGISDNDLHFLALMNSENGLWTPDRVHGDGAGRGFCGISYPWHKEVIEDERFISDPEWQIQKCYDFYKKNCFSHNSKSHSYSRQSS